MIVNWSDITAECGNYKAGFVAVFRKYEGQLTDTGDRVSARSFADRMGIPRQTFQTWLKRDADADFASAEAREARTTASHANVAKNLARKDPGQLAAAIALAGPQALDDVYHELKLRRAGVDTSEANRKAAHAGAHRAAEPFRRNIATAGLTLCVAALREAQEYLAEAISEGAATEEAMAPVNAAFERFSFTLAEARFKVS